MFKIKDKWLRIARTGSLYLSFFSLSLSVLITGPTLLDLQNIVKTDTQHITFILTSRSVGYLIGSLIGGAAYEMVSRKQPLLIVSSFGMAASILVTPWCPSLPWLVGIMAVCGISMGVLETGDNVCCLELWGKDSGPYFQALHFTFGIGGFVAPLIAAQFLAGIENIDNSNSTNITLLESPSENHTESLISTLPTTESTIPTVTYAYAIIGSFALLVTILFLVLYLLEPEDKNANDKENKDTKAPGRVFTILVVIVVSLLFAMYIGSEIGFAQMLTTYAVKGNLKLPKTTGSLMVSAFWTSFTVVRGISIFLALKMSSFSMMLCDLVITLTACIVLLTLGTVYESGLWVGTVLMGAGIASFYPSVIAWIDNYINVTSTVTAIILIGAASGEMALPVTIGAFIETVPEVLFYMILTSTLMCCVFTALLYIVLLRADKKYTEEVKLEKF